MEADFYRDAWAEINLDAIAANVRNMNALLSPDTEIMAVVKANGYGHGALEVAKTALESGATWLAVALMDEALALRAEGIEAPILVMGRVRPNDLHLAAENQISVTVFQKEWAEEASLNYQGKHPVFIHLKLDTGMGRLGVREYTETLELIDQLKKDPRFIIEGAYTHFATADEENESYFEQQYGRFMDMLEWLKSRQVKPNLIHCGNSAAALKHPNRMHNLVRFGISMYGLLPAEEMKEELPFPLEQAFSLYSRLVHCKQVPPNEGISYGATYFTQGEEWIGTVPVGYADGWLRALAFKSDVLADGHRIPIVGRICMDQFMCRLPYEMTVGTKITLIGGEDDPISVQEVASRLNTISYEIPCMISSRIPRLYFKDGKKVGGSNKVLDPFIK
jgi:alanine racemase